MDYRLLPQPKSEWIWAQTKILKTLLGTQLLWEGRNGVKMVPQTCWDTPG